MEKVNKESIVAGFKFYLFDFFAGLIVGIVSIIVNSTYKPYNRFFTERDPSLSYPYIPDAQNAVPLWLLAILGVLIPIIIIFVTQLMMYYAPYFSHFPKSPYVTRVLLPYLTLAESFAVTYLVTAVVKSFVGRKRPNFFAFCNYQGYRDALATNNFTMYDSLTKEGRPGSIDNCFDQSSLKEPQFSFPSGHASIVFAGLTVAFWFVLHVIPQSSDVHEKWHFRFWRVFTLIILLGIATIVACTRTRDYWHNFDDILAGSLIGLACGFFTVYINTHVRREEDNSIVSTPTAPV